jgi:hypothetical protein
METLGLGGGGNMGAPAISPHQPNIMFVACDLGGLYRSEDFGKSWQVVDARKMRGDNNSLRLDGNAIPACAVVFDPDNKDMVYAYAPFRGLRYSTDGGKTFNANQTLFPDPAPASQNPPQNMTVLGIDPLLPGSPALFGTALGIFQWDKGTQQYVKTNLFDSTGAQFNAVGFFVERFMHGNVRTFYAAAGNAIYTRAETETEKDWKVFKDFGKPVQSFAGVDDMNGTTLYVTLGHRSQQIPMGLIDSDF